MPRYYFDWEILGVLEVDRRGMMLPDVTSAIEVATDCAVELVADDIRRGDAESAGVIHVRDGQGRVLHRITLAEARVLTTLAATNAQ